MGVYQWVEPTRKHAASGELRPVKSPTTTTYKNQINSKCSSIESECNKLWRRICSNHDSIDYKCEDLFVSSYSVLPTLYTLVKTHKFPAETNFSTVDITDLKVRPIVSCCGSPTEKLAWLVTDIISPLLKFVPSHLNNIYTHLDQLARLTPEELTGLQFFTADITALYTNLSISECIDSVIELAEEHWESLETYGLSLLEIQEILETVLNNSYFTFNGRLFKQLIGLFMGCRPSPVVAIIRVYVFERKSIYIDVHFISRYIKLHYGRYVDDASSLAQSRSEAENIVQMIADQDPDNRIKWEVDFPESPDDFTPFLGTEIKIDNNGKFHSRYYRKEQDKGLTLHQKSAHPDRTKEETVKNFYKTAINVSTGPEELQHSLQIVDDLLQKNGYQHPRSLAGCNPKKRRRKKNHKNSVPLQLPFISEYISNKIRNYIQSHKMAIRVTFTPGRKLKSIFCRSRPLDKKVCDLGNQNNCKICPNLTDTTCATKNAVYLVTCELCREMYCGETERSLHSRLMEHQRAAQNPVADPDNAVGQHYMRRHPKQIPKLSYKLLDIQPVTVRRKIVEEIYILREKTAINDRTELSYLCKYLIQ